MRIRSRFVPFYSFSLTLRSGYFSSRRYLGVLITKLESHSSLFVHSIEVWPSDYAWSYLTYYTPSVSDLKYKTSILLKGFQE